MRLQKGGAYTSALRSIRSSIRKNGSTPCLKEIHVSHPGSERTVKLYMNIALEQNANFEKVNGALYTVAIGNTNGTWHFNVGDIKTQLPGRVFPGAPNGSYKSLGFPDTLPSISDANLAESIESLDKYNGEALAKGVKTNLARIIIAVSEATRFMTVERRIDAVLGKSGSCYSPPYDTIHNWGGRLIGCVK